MLLQQPRVVHLDDLTYNKGLNVMILHSPFKSTSSSHICNIISIERHCVISQRNFILHQLTPDRGHSLFVVRTVRTVY